MAYADYTYYTERFGGTMGEDDFTRLSKQAGLFIDRYTLGQASQSDACDALADCACALTELLHEAGQKTVVSEQNDGLRITYADPAQGNMAAGPAGLAALCRLYLADTGLCQRTAGS